MSKTTAKQAKAEAAQAIAAAAKPSAPAAAQLKAAREAALARTQAEEQERAATVQPATAFYAHLPSEKFIHAPTGALWTTVGVDAACVGGTGGTKPSAWLRAHRPVHGITWDPAEPQLIVGKAIDEEGMWVHDPSLRVFNQYRPSVVAPGDHRKAKPWLDLLKRLYPDDWPHLLMWFAHRIQRPGEKVNHAIVLGGETRIGKDTLLQPVIAGVGAANVRDAEQAQLVSGFTEWAKCALLRVNEARSAEGGGQIDRKHFYERSKTIIAAPPDVIRINEKHTKPYFVRNVCGVVFTTNHRTGSLFFPTDDERHFVAWSPAKSADWSPAEWGKFNAWLDNGGTEHVVAYLQREDIARFNPKAPPPKTQAFWALAGATEDPVKTEWLDAIDALGKPAALTLDMLRDAASGADGGVVLSDLLDTLNDRKVRRTLSHRLAEVDYTSVPNPAAPSNPGWKFATGRKIIYGRSELSAATREKAARALVAAERHKKR